MLKKLIIMCFIFVACFIYTATALAQTVSLSADVDKPTVSLDDNIVLTVTVSGEVRNLPDPNLPKINGFTVYSSGRSQNISFVNGVVSTSLVYNYVLSPRSVGKYTIDPIVLKYKDKEYKTNPISVEVVTAQQTIPGTSSQGDQSNKDAKGLFITTTVDKGSVYVNEPIILTFRFYSRVSLLSNPAYNPPSTTGFWTEDLPPQKNYVGAYEGVNYRINEIKTALFPTAPGKYTISPAELQCHIENFSSDGDDFFQRFFSQGKTVTLRSNQIVINVKALPEEGKPSSFSGTVGDYMMTVEIDRDNVEVGEALNLIVSINGEGNIKSIGEPELKNITNYKKYDTITSHDISKKDYKVTGSKTFKIVLAPNVTGTIALPEVEFSFFDIKTKKYQILRSSKKTIRVAPSTRKGETDLTGNAKVNDVKFIADDIRFIKQKTKLNSGNLSVFNRLWFILTFLIFPLTYFSLVGVSVYKERISKDKVLYRRKRALKNSLHKIDEANKRLEKGNSDAPQILFYALSEYIGCKFNLSPSGLTLKAVEDILDKNQTDDIIKTQIKEIWDKLDFMRFAPSQVTQESVKQVSAKLREYIVGWDKELR